MFCQWCGARLSEGATQCAACGKPTPAVPPSASAGASHSSGDSIDRAINEATHAAHELADAAHRVAHEMVRRARGEAPTDVSKKAKEALHQVADELREAGKEVGKILDDL